MSWAFITAMKKNPQQSYVQLLNSIRDELQTKYTQKPQLSCSHPLSKSRRFPSFLGAVYVLVCAMSISKSCDPLAVPSRFIAALPLL